MDGEAGYADRDHPRGASCTKRSVQTVRGMADACPWLEEDAMVLHKEKTLRGSPRISSRPPLPVPEALIEATPVADVVRVPERTVVAIDGVGPPEGAAFPAAIGAIYGVAYGIKFAQKARGKDFRIGPLEALWWADPLPASLAAAPRESWRWQLRMGVPGHVHAGEVSEVARSLIDRQRHKAEIAAAAKGVRLLQIPAQTLGRILHVGPYAEEEQSIRAAQAALVDAGLTPKGPHIEVYLNDPRRTASTRLKTVILIEPSR
ncbi:MAG TPA: GyrI-like domain-containing protein [Myxococcales bacterium]|nr:GyrI-like domain-containing protein [Myxococcales bacterium]